MRTRFIGTLSSLNAPQAQNDIWLVQGDPHNVVAGDERLIFQAVSPFVTIAYTERFQMGVWWADDIHPALNVVALRNPQYAANLPVPQGIVQLANPNVALNGNVDCFLITWVDRLHITRNVPNGNVGMWYIPHQKRGKNEIYLRPMPQTVHRDITLLAVGMQISKYRQRQF